ncbi:hypothetical protein CGMCC3_g11958 [Colletotrichum fructicola]|uniref:Uncharacterized protein n=1 Tax=Colletotrichum fructicola (strain Nara gc5) TaxID=1213859 RepID=L2FEX9_COLFN|nr:uncharacterized protein CGMCC3_g11958 [Colletotrichum fructicola]KAE9571867.1 hypothetical protein CGMCC3_g11958 [Colletotrichum fructicola]KAF4428551.1 hypothetical protein CFRS1_v007352 [Colletotrichum fructicola]KAF4477538.1 hypothetical protein CGGC5_v013164 [Colletotrichum fructicola Nara gc5]
MGILWRTTGLLVGLSSTSRVYASNAELYPLANRGTLYHRDIWNDSTIIPNAVKEPNATGSWPIVGIDLSKPLVNPPDSTLYGRGNGWSIEVKVATNRTNGDTPKEEPERNAVWNINPVTIDLEGPENAFEAGNVSSNYSFCSYVWNGISDPYTKKDLETLDEDTDGSCNGWISNMCIEDLKQAARTARCNSTTGDLIHKPDSCGKKIDPLSYLIRNLTNQTEATANNDTGPVYSLYSWVAGIFNASDEKETNDSYNEALTRVWPVILSFNYDDGENQTDYQVFRCVRANNVVQGSREPDGFGDRPNMAGTLEWSVSTMALGLGISLGISSVF